MHQTYMLSGIAALEGFVREDLTGIHLVEICAVAPNEVSRAPSLTGPIFSNNQDVHSVEARAFGILVSHPSFPDTELSTLVTQLVEKIESWNTAIGKAVLRILAFAYLLSRLVFR